MNVDTRQDAPGCGNVVRSVVDKSPAYLGGRECLDLVTQDQIGVGVKDS
jgi:hypothetical protein